MFDANHITNTSRTTRPHESQECFRESVPEAIERGCYEMDTACLEAQLRALGRETSLSSPDTPPRTANDHPASPSAEGERWGEASHTTATAGARLSSRARAADAAACAGGNCLESPEHGQGWTGASAEQRRQSRKTSSGSDARSRLSGASSGFSGGATAVVAVVTKVGQVSLVGEYCHGLAAVLARRTLLIKRR